MSLIFFNLALASLMCLNGDFIKVCFAVSLSVFIRFLLLRGERFVHVLTHRHYDKKREKQQRRRQYKDTERDTVPEQIFILNLLPSHVALPHNKRKKKRKNNI